MATWDDKARIYALASPASIYRARDVIARAVLEVLQVPPGPKHRVTISESSGWWSYAAIGEVWDRRTPPSLPSQADAVRISEKMLGDLERRVSAVNKDWPEELRAVQLLPPMGLLKRVGARVVANPVRRDWDHWLYRAQPHLHWDGSGKVKAIVFGSQIEVRVGHLGQIVGIQARWQPLSGEKKFTDFRPFQAPAEEESRDPHAGKRQPPVNVFVLDGDGVPQYYLAPYYFSTDGHDIDLSGASAWSLTVDIGRTAQDERRMTLTALARGGSGDYRYRWAAYSPADLTAGWRDLGTGSSSMITTNEGRAIASSIQLDNGHYVVMLNVKDRKTGAFKHHQQQAFSSPFVSGAAGGGAALVS